MFIIQDALRSHHRQGAAILEAALRRFLYYGLKKTTIQEIACDAGVAVGTLYLYFKDKDALVVGCADRFVGAPHLARWKRELQKHVSSSSKASVISRRTKQPTTS